jgi:hypothetical protein
MTQEKLSRCSCRSTAAGVEALETGGEQRLEGDPPKGQDSPCAWAGAPEAIGKAKGDALPKAGHQEALPATEVAPPTAEHGRAAPMLPDLSQCEDSCAWTKGAYPV